MTEFEYTITDSLGIHARPAGMLVNEAKKYKSKITFEVRGLTADGKRIFAVMGLGAKQRDRLRVICEGEDEEAAALSIKGLLEAKL